MLGWTPPLTHHRCGGAIAVSLKTNVTFYGMKSLFSYAVPTFYDQAATMIIVGRRVACCRLQLKAPIDCPSDMH